MNIYLAYLYFKLVLCSNGAFYFSLNGLREKYFILYYQLNCSLLYHHIRSDSAPPPRLFLLKFQKWLQFVVGFDGILKYIEISGQFFTHMTQMVTRWYISPTDWIFLVKLAHFCAWNCSISCVPVSVSLVLLVLRLVASRYPAGYFSSFIKYFRTGSV